MNEIEQAVKNAEEIARDNSIGYSQDANKRWTTERDCATLIIDACERAGILLKTLGATYTGDMSKALKTAGFFNVKSMVSVATGANLKRGDILLRPKTSNKGGHTAFYTGSGMIVHAVSNELGKITGGKVGDQTGREIREESYYNSPWTEVWRLSEVSEVVTVRLARELRYNGKDKPMTSGDDVRAWQNVLNVKADGQFGPVTENATKEWQKKHKLNADGIVGPKTAQAAGWVFSTVAEKDFGTMVAKVVCHYLNMRLEPGKGVVIGEASHGEHLRFNGKRIVNGKEWLHNTDGSWSIAELLERVEGMQIKDLPLV